MGVGDNRVTKMHVVERGARNDVQHGRIKKAAPARS
jgi:hypothetical protein